jgi:hypothetical protein
MDDGFLPGTAFGIMTMLVVGGFVIASVNDSWRDQIATHGCAHYYLDTNSQRQWDWIKP